MSERLDAAVVGSGPNGLVAAVMLARAGYSVRVFEANDTCGGGARTATLTLPGFHHDVCSAVHPLGASSPAFAELGIERYGLEWLHPEVTVAHPFEDGSAGILHRSLERTTADLGTDGPAYRALVSPFVDRWADLAPDLLGPITRIPKHPLLMARFGLAARRSASGLARSNFRDAHTRALFAGIAAHASLPLRQPLTAAFGLLLAAAGHAAGWPFAKGGSQAITDALLRQLREHGGEVVTNYPVHALGQLPEARAVLFDVTPKQLLAIAGEQFNWLYRKQLQRYRYGTAVFKLDYALSGPVPWKSDACRRAGTVHIGGDLAEISRSEWEVAHGLLPERPFVLAAQQSLFDPTRAPAGQHTFWAYCHVPLGSPFDMRERIEAQIERFAPGFRDLILARHVTNPARLEAEDANHIGGDISGGSPGGLQLFFRPGYRLNPYTTGAPAIYLCSSSTPPGPGVHGMCGYWSAKAAMRELEGAPKLARIFAPM